MDTAVFADIMSYFPKSHKTAKTIKELAAIWPSDQTEQAKLWHLYRCVDELSSDITAAGNFVIKIPGTKGQDAMRPRGFTSTCPKLPISS